jgi:transketolase
VDNPQPSYLRIGKAGEPCYHLLPPELIAGKWVKVKEGIRTDLAILTTGSALKHGLKMVGESEYEGCCVFTLPLWGMGYKCMQANQIGNFERITTIEDHLLDGGFGSWLLESLDSTPQMRSRVRIKAIDSKVCAMVGSQDSLELEGGL